MIPWLSVVVPMRNEAAIIGRTLAALQPLRAAGGEVIVVDGASTDSSRPTADPLADQVLSSEPGRARQMNAGIEVARGDWVWLLHADSSVVPEHWEAIRQSRQNWGFFKLRLSGAGLLLRVIERSINLRTRLTHLATGDQGIFVRREWLNAMNGLPDLPLMEDLALTRALRRRGRPAIMSPPLVTSSRRWEERGVVRTVLLMWGLRAAWRLGVSPARLARIYQRPQR
ncbi:MAG: TIGR04283 family arsenosugar biosynthesis glycosyltransferase [Pseudomonadota bacterium]